MTRPTFTLPTVSPEEAAECDRIVQAVECEVCGAIGCSLPKPPASRARVDSAWPEGRHERGWPDSGGIARANTTEAFSPFAYWPFNERALPVRPLSASPTDDRPEPFVDGQRRITIDATPEEVEEIWRRRCSDIDPGKAFAVYVTALVCACVAVGAFAVAVTLGWVVVP